MFRQISGNPTNARLLLLAKRPLFQAILVGSTRKPVVGLVDKNKSSAKVIPGGGRGIKRLL